MLVARGLGPEQYGTMMFLLGTFAAVRQLLDMGSSTAFFTFLSQRQRSRRFVYWYFAWFGVQFLIPLLVVGLVFPAEWVELIWKGEQRSLVILAFLAAYMQSVLWSIILQMGESQRLTRWVQSVAVAIALVHLLLMVMAWWGGWLGVRLIFLLMIIEWGIAVAVIVKQLRFSTLPDESDTPKAVLMEFWRYCLPLIPYAWIGFAYEFADRWLLQNYGGSVQQAYYAVAYQFGAVAALATSSILNIFWKEIAEAHHQGNMERVRALYRKVSRGLFFVAASVSGLLMPWSEDILRLALGPAYVGGAGVLAMMFLYPIHQSMGQVGGTMMYAMGHVRAQVAVGMAFMVLSIAVSWFVLTPQDADIPGLGLGSVGLACKMVVMQFLGVNVIAWYLAKRLETVFDWQHQLIVLACCIGAGWLAYIATGWLFDTSAPVVGSFLFSTLLFAAMTMVVVWFAPSLAGVSRGEISGMVHRFRLST